MPMFLSELVREVVKPDNDIDMSCHIETGQTHESFIRNKDDGWHGAME